MGATWPGLVYVLPDGLTEPQAQAVADQLVYSSDDITGLRLNLGRRELLVRTRLEADRERLQAMIHRLVDDVSADNVHEARVIWRTGSPVGGIGDYDGDPAIHARLHRLYDRMFLEFAIRFGAAERVYPSMIDLAVLDRCR